MAVQPGDRVAGDQAQRWAVPRRLVPLWVPLFMVWMLVYDRERVRGDAGEHRGRDGAGRR